MMIFYPSKRKVRTQNVDQVPNYSENVLNGKYKVTINNKTRGRVTVKAKHNFLQHSLTFEEVWIDVVAVQFVDADGNLVNIPANTGFYDLLKLSQDMKSVFTKQYPLPEGRYKQIRLVLAGDGNYVVSNGENYPLFVPSAHRSGLKLDGEFNIISGFFTEITLDFNIEIIHYSPGKGFIMRPVIDLLNVKSNPPFIDGYLIVHTKEKLEISEGQYGLNRVTNDPDINQLNDQYLLMFIKPYLDIFSDRLNDQTLAFMTKSGLDKKYYFHFYKTTDIVEAMFAYLQLPNVEKVYMNTVTSGNYLPQDIVAQPDTGEFGQGPYLNAIRAYDAWDVTKGSPDIKIAVIDSGIDDRNADLNGRVAAHGGYKDEWCEEKVCDSCGCETNKYECTIPNNDSSYIGSHGTGIAGILGAPGNNGPDGIAGMNWYSPLLSYKTMQYDQSIDSQSTLSCNGGEMCGTMENNMNAIYDAINDGANVINISQSMEGYQICWYNIYDQKSCNSNVDGLHGAILRAEEANVVVVASIGNGMEYNGDYIGDWTCVAPVINGCETIQLFPAAWESVISVASLNVNTLNPLSTNATSSFSNFGKVDIAAPGSDILTTYPGVGNQKNYETGTSFAVPMVAGLASLILSKNKTLTAKEVRQIIYDTARDIPFGGGYPPNCYTGAGKDVCTGHGMIDMGAALNSTPEPQPPEEETTTGGGCG